MNKPEKPIKAKPDPKKPVKVNGFHVQVDLSRLDSTGFLKALWEI